ncbi:hypothetical protein DFQ30_006798 [Apophysomyces sp. BC1015]|nr:hypothetical protein DFQ30_006798 [Apophysomyces sp. BC1015]
MFEHRKGIGPTLATSENPLAVKIKQQEQDWSHAWLNDSKNNAIATRFLYQTVPQSMSPPWPEIAMVGRCISMETHRLVATTKKIRLCVIDYAGLSTDPIVIQRMLRLNKNIKELVVVHQSKIEVLTRYDLKDPIVAKKFACRTGPVHQSK